MKTKIIPLIGLLVFGMSFCGCKDKTVEMTGISVSPTSIWLVYGGTPDSQQITAEAVPENATGVNFSWASGDNAIAAVSRSGLVTATGIGSTEVSVMAGNRVK
ncbi:MAG: Ig-like domain-containing protein, partial [Tannerella sp.]|nr:Ig-like domain-containing protein [Tannerella sp.]